LLIDSLKGLVTQPVGGPHTVRSDGTVGIGIYGPAFVAGKTVEEARKEIALVIHGRLDKKAVTLKDVEDNLNVNVLAYNSSFYYVIVDGAGLGEQVFRHPVTGNETVLDAISLVGGLQFYSSPRRIWVARRNAGDHGQESILPVDWRAITRGGQMVTNWQMMPGDRLYVQADPMRRFNNNLSKFLEPIEKVLGATLLGGQTVNTIKNGTTVTR
jgi:polysaccharide export outer membrane protein